MRVAVVALLMLAGLGLFVDLDWGRFPLWLAALAAGGAGVRGAGPAIGALTREVRAASLLAFMLCLPLAFLGARAVAARWRPRSTT